MKAAQRPVQAKRMNVHVRIAYFARTMSLETVGVATGDFGPGRMPPDMF